jgi:hypothetical protein
VSLICSKAKCKEQKGLCTCETVIAVVIVVAVFLLIIFDMHYSALGHKVAL